MYKVNNDFGIMVGEVETPIKSKEMLPENIVDLIKQFEKEGILKINNLDNLCNRMWYIFSNGVLDFNEGEE